MTPVQVIERLTLRRLTASDTDYLSPLDNDSRVVRLRREGLHAE